MNVIKIAHTYNPKRSPYREADLNHRPNPVCQSAVWKRFENVFENVFNTRIQSVFKAQKRYIFKTPKTFF